MTKDDSTQKEASFYEGQQNIIHRDIKLENILLKRKDKSGIVVADLGSWALDHQ